LNESVHGVQPQEIEDDACADNCDYDIDGLTPTIIKPDSSSASPSSIDKISPISPNGDRSPEFNKMQANSTISGNLVDSEVDPAMTKSEI
jgi:hypothetical protein